MSTTTQIEWTDATWNPVTGCSKITRGCEFCYAERFSERFRGVHGHPFENGFDLILRPERLTQPLHWQQPRRIFVNSMSDLFHKEVPKPFVDSVFDIMETADWHTFQVLTKRSSLMVSYLRSRYGSALAPPHIWLGVSIEDAKNAVRLKHLRAAQASVKFISFEPLLGPVGKVNLTGIDWAIVGGESGPQARPMAEEWAIEIRDQCRAAKVAFFFKQWGGIRPKSGGRHLRGREWNQYPRVRKDRAMGALTGLQNRKAKRVTDPYSGREQTKAKHFILRHYLQALAFKVLTFSDITYVDGFSGPWRTQSENFSDSSFKIAISVLQAAQKHMRSVDHRRRIRCFFSESNAEAFAQLRDAVAPFHKPEEEFEIKTYFGRFEDSVSEIEAFIGNSFPLIFIDPRGWTGYPFDKIKALFARPKCEVLINFMYDHVNRFAHSDDEDIIASLDPILGGPGWRDRLDPKLPRGLAVEKLFRETLRSVGNFDFVISTKIDKATAERPHFFIAYGTKSSAGLKAFRQTEYDALRKHAMNRATAKEKKREEQSNTVDLFAGYHAEMQEATIDQIVEEQKELASDELMAILQRRGPTSFFSAVVDLIQAYMLRETNIKDICVDLAKADKIENTWGGRDRKPSGENEIRLKSNTR
jgi:three-Cys-motif partner protein